VPYGVYGETRARLSKLLTEEVAATGAKFLAATLRQRGGQPLVLAASAGAPVAFKELCLGLAEAPHDGGLRELEVDGLGRVMWQAPTSVLAGQGEVLIFALHDTGRLTRTIALVDRLLAN